MCVCVCVCKVVVDNEQNAFRINKLRMSVAALKEEEEKKTFGHTLKCNK